MATLSRELHRELTGLVEDVVEHYCDKNMMSGELTWVIIECLAVAKQAQIRGEVD